jgi:citrate synthase
MCVNVDSMINISGPPVEQRFLTAAEAAAALGVREATLYAYVSRGLLRSEGVPGRRRRRYPRADVEALQRRVSGRRDPPRVAREALAWGEPVLDSALTRIAGGRLYYRGLDAIELALRGETLERVAALLWTGDLAAPLPQVPAGRRAVVLRLAQELAAARAWRPFRRLESLLPLVAGADPAAGDLRPRAVLASASWLLQLMAAIAAGTSAHLETAGGGGAAAVLARAWAAPAEQEEVTRRLDAALVVCADHELNVSAFTARCVASAGAPPYAAVTAALAALGGFRHGGLGDRVEALLAELAPPSGSGSPPKVDGATVRAHLAERLRRGDPIPGFGLRLYPDGDPRARLLLELAAAARPASPAVELARELAAAAFDLLGERPNVDFGLAALARTLGLPAGAPLGLFAVGRAAGWIAHVLEQYADARLIRPRARYTGP